MSITDILFPKKKNSFLVFFDHVFMLAKLSPDGVFLDVNDTLVTLSGYQKEELLNTNVTLLCNYEIKKDLNQFSSVKQSQLEKQEQQEYCFQKKDGPALWLQAVLFPIYSKENTLECIVLFGNDITKYKQFIEETNDRVKALDSILLVAEYLPDGKILSVNSKFLSFLDYPFSAIKSKTRDIFFSEKKRYLQNYKQLWDYISSGHECFLQEELINSRGDSLWIEGSYYPVFYRNGQVQKIVHTASDITWKIKKSIQKMDDIKNLRKLSLAGEKTDNAVIISDHLLNTTFVNESFIRMFGYSLEEIVGKNSFIVFGPEERDICDKINTSFENNTPLRSENITYGKNGHRLWVSHKSIPIFDSKGERQSVISILSDITEIKIREILYNKALETIIQGMPTVKTLTLICQEVAFIVPEAIVIVLKFNSKKNITPLASTKLSEEYLDPLIANTTKVLFSEKVLLTGKTIATENIHEGSQWEDSKKILFTLGLTSVRIVPFKSSEEDILGAITFFYSSIGTSHDFPYRITQVISRLCSLTLERERSKADVKRLTLYDSLTGLPNHANFLSKLNSLLLDATFNKTSASVIVANLDRFRLINSSLGNSSGDDILRDISIRFKESFPPPYIIGRMFSDGFVIAINDCSPTKILDVINKINLIVSQPQRFGNVTLILSASIGISTYPECGESPETLLHNASTAMIRAKAKGIGKFCFFSERHDEKVKKLLAMESSLRGAIGSDEVKLYYQPQICMQTGTVHGAEALARWFSPFFGSVPPDKFIPIAESGGLMNRLGEWVLHESCRQLEKWRKNNMRINSVSINMSTTNLQDTEFPEKVMRSLSEHGLTTNDLIIELTENILLDKNPTVAETIDRSYAMGLHFSLDDFGTGYSSLSYLRSFPIAELKLDKSFVRDIEKSKTNQCLSQAVIDIGKTLDLVVVAEGIEASKQFTILKDQGYDIAQGFLFSPALPAHSFEEWVSKYYYFKKIPGYYNMLP